LARSPAGCGRSLRFSSIPHPAPSSR
jgi:hypothetical protein